MPYVVLMPSSLLIAPINTSKHISYLSALYVYMYDVMVETNIKTSCSFFQILGYTHKHIHKPFPSLVHNMRHTAQSTRSAHIPFFHTYYMRILEFTSVSIYFYSTCVHILAMMIPEKNSKLNGNHIMRHNIKII